MCDIDAAKVQRVAEEHRCRAFADCEAMLAESKPELLLFARRPATAAGR